MPASEFLAKSREALNEASERVRKKFGFACTAAMSSLQDIESFCANLSDDAAIKIISI